MNFFDKLIPFFVGHRSEILGAIYTVLRILSTTGVIDQHVVDSVGEVIRPAMVMTFAAKLSRLATDTKVAAEAQIATEANTAIVARTEFAKAAETLPFRG